MTTNCEAGLDLYWIRLGGGGYSVSTATPTTSGSSAQRILREWSPTWMGTCSISRLETPEGRNVDPVASLVEVPGLATLHLR